jgi:two-component system cell cycle sensor histidine kinase/response regulator CckA
VDVSSCLPPVKRGGWRLARSAIRNRFKENALPGDDGMKDVDKTKEELIQGLAALRNKVAELEAAEDVLRETEARYHTLVEQVPAALYIDAIDETSSTIYMSSQVEALLGYTAEEWQADPELWLKLLHPDDRPRVLAEHARTNATHEPFRMEYRLVSRDGRTVWVYDDARVVRDEAGRPRYWQGILSDITERKRAEAQRAAALAALGESERRYREVFENTTDCIFLLDVAAGGRFKAAGLNPAGEKAVGLSAADVAGKYTEEFLAPGLAEVMNANYRRCVEAGVPISYEETLPLPAGEASFSTTLIPVADAAGRTYRVVGIAHDISGLKRAEAQRAAALAALQESEQRFRTIFDAVEEAIFVHDLETGAILDVNRRACEMFGYAHEDFRRLSVEDLSSGEAPYTQAGALERLKKAAGGEAQLFEWRAKDSRGRLFWIEMNIKRTAIGRQERLLATGHDITERRQAQEALGFKVEQLAALSQAARVVNASLELDQVLAEIVSLAAKVAPADYAGVLLVDEAGHPRRSVENLPCIPALPYRIRDGGFTRWIIRSREAVIVDEIGPDGAVTPDPAEGAPRLANPHLVEAGVKALAGLPLLVRGRLAGVLYLHSRRAGAFRDQLSLLTVFANQAAIAVENARLYEAAQQELAERRRAEEALRQSEGRLRLITDNMLDMVSQVNLEGNHVYVSPAHKRVLGYEPEELVGKSILDLLHPVDVERVAGAIQAALQTREPARVEFRYRHADGHYLWLESVGKLLLDDDGSPIGAVFSGRDITERKRAEEGLRQRNRELALLNQIIAASAITQEPGAILEAACRELTGAFDTPRTIAALLNEQKTEAVIVAEYSAAGPGQAALGQALRVKGNPVLQYLLSCRGPLAVDDAPNDPRLDAMRDLVCRRGVASALFIPLVVEDRVLGSLCLGALQPRHFSPEEVSLAWNVADQVAGALARAQLAQAQKRLVTAIEQTADSVIITDAQGIILYVNRGFEEVSGYRCAELVGKDVRTLANGEHDAAFLDSMWATAGAGQVWRGRFVHRRKDGSPYTEDASVTPVLDEGGAVVSCVAVQRDVTRQLQLEEQYRQAQKMEAVGRLTAGIAHDFNNLLTAINGFAELARSKAAPGDPLAESLDKVLSSGWRAADLVRQLMAFSRKQLVDPEVLSLNAVVADVDKLLKRVIGEHIALKTTLAPDLWPVRVDSAQIEQVIVNLAVNARDAMPGGGHLTIETCNVALDEDYTARHFGVPPGQYVVLAVSDDGIGMSDEVKAHLFEPFFTTKAPGKGTGLGLATIFGIVRGSGGHVGCYSEEGQGTTIRVYLPRVPGVAPSAARRDEAGDLPRGSETILLVEDDASVRELAARALRQQGYTVLEAAGGAEALRLARERRQAIHLLLTDVVMPGLGGEVLAEQAVQVCPGLKVLFMSGYTDDAISHRGVLEPGVSFLQKPFGPLALARKVRAVLDAT